VLLCQVSCLLQRRSGPLKGEAHVTSKLQGNSRGTCRTHTHTKTAYVDYCAVPQ
jgi:hypothetical protein